MNQTLQLSDGEKMRLNRFLRRCELQLNHLGVMERTKMMNATRDYLMAQITEERKIDKILLSYRDVTALLNQLLIANGLPLVTKKKRSILGPIFLVILITLSLFIFGIYWSIHRAFNWFESNVELNFDTQNVQINDGKIRFGNIADYPGFKSANLQNTQQGEIKDIQLQSIEITAETGVLYVATGDYFSFECKTDRDNYNPVRLEATKLHLNLLGQNQCQLYLPAAIPLTFKLQHGVLKITGLEQDFSALVQNGTIFWESQDPALFEVESKVNGLSINTGNFAAPQKGKYKARFDVVNGVLKIK